MEFWSFQIVASDNTCYGDHCYWYQELSLVVFCRHIMPSCLILIYLKLVKPWRRGGWGVIHSAPSADDLFQLNIYTFPMRTLI